jgi:hypothetical protein
MSDFKVGDEVWYFCDNTDATGAGMVISNIILFNGTITDISTNGEYMTILDSLGEEIVTSSSCFLSKSQAIASMRNHLNELELVSNS